MTVRRIILTLSPWVPDPDINILSTGAPNHTKVADVVDTLHLRE